jgi:membrane-associated protease RseP (regulator of RpoE activity)
MKSYLRLVLACSVTTFTLGGSAFAAEQHVIAAQDIPALLSHSSTSYLGVEIRDIDNSRASALKLRTPTGAEIIAVDHDGPAGKAGLRVHDVILQMNGQPVAGREQLSRMIHETPAGRSVSLVISRDGQQQSLSLQLADRDTIEQDAWSQHMVVPAPDDDDDFILEGPTSHGLEAGNSFFGAFTFGSPSVGLDLDVLGSQLADYFGVKNGQGLLVKRVVEDSPASKAGLKAGDVITSANGQSMATINEWIKLLHANKGKQVQVTFVRNHKEQTVTLDAGNGHGTLILPDDFKPLDLTSFHTQLAQLETRQLKEQIDPEAIRQQVKKAEDSIDWKNIQQEMEAQQQQLNQQMQQIKDAMQSLDLDQME